MPYNGSGSFILAQAAFIPGTPISSSAMNSDLADIATNGLTNAVVKDGQTTITGAFKGANGTVSLPMYSFASDLDSGMYRVGANHLGIGVAGAEVLDISTAGVDVTGTLSVNGSPVTPNALTITPQGRLTLVTATPVMTTTQAAKTTIFYTPYLGDLIPLYDGVVMTPTIFTELSVLTTNTTKSPAAIGASKVNDWFVWNDAGTLRIGHGPDWTTDSTRSAGTALVMVNGILLNSVSITNGPAASRGTYVGTTRSNGSSQLDWIFGALAAGGTAGFFSVWNTYNRRPVASVSRDSTDSWTYATGAWRQANAAAGMQTTYVCGLAEDAVNAQYSVLSAPTVSNNGVVGIGINTYSAFSGTTGLVGNTAAVTSISGAYGGVPGLGFNSVAAIEYANIGSGVVTFYGDLGVAWYQSGLVVNLWA